MNFITKIKSKISPNDITKSMKDGKYDETKLKTKPNFLIKKNYKRKSKQVLSISPVEFNYDRMVRKTMIPRILSTLLDGNAYCERWECPTYGDAKTSVLCMMLKKELSMFIYKDKFFTCSNKTAICISVGKANPNTLVLIEKYKQKNACLGTKESREIPLIPFIKQEKPPMYIQLSADEYNYLKSCNPSKIYIRSL